jgi:hypothetical protein
MYNCWFLHTQGQKPEKKTVAECRNYPCDKNNCWFLHTQGQKPEKKTEKKTVAECRNYPCDKNNCWFLHTQGQKPVKKTVEQPAPVIDEVPEQSPEFYAEFCSDDDAENGSDAENGNDAENGDEDYENRLVLIDIINGQLEFGACPEERAEMIMYIMGSLIDKYNCKDFDKFLTFENDTMSDSKQESFNDT